MRAQRSNFLHVSSKVNLPACEHKGHVDAHNCLSSELTLTFKLTCRLTYLHCTHTVHTLQTFDLYIIEIKNCPFSQMSWQYHI